ncbi:MAG: DUF2461 domain-containing protein [Bacteroidia bacterium]|nr:DUF2461 domain-containing protein [Bacteroidia bacterium]
MTTIRKSTLQFLKNIAKNNNKAWFDEHKNDYLDAKANMENFMQAIMDRLNKSDAIEKYHLYRIYRDVRFSKDKTPYKTFLHAYLKREGAERRGGYWVGVEPGNTHIGGGFYGPEKDDLFRIRKEFEQDGDTINGILNEPRFKTFFGGLKGEGLKTAPKGFDKEHKNIELIRKKQFYAMRPFSDAEVTSTDFVDNVVETLEAIRPFFDYMSDVLTTDLNGVSTL